MGTFIRFSVTVHECLAFHVFLYKYDMFICMLTHMCINCLDR